MVSYPIWFSWWLAGSFAVAADSWHSKTARQESICPSVTLTDDKDSRAGHVQYFTMDCDDTIATFALNLGAEVLSQDSDFFR